MKTRRMVEALIKHLGLEFRYDFDYGALFPMRKEGRVFCPDDEGITNRVNKLERVVECEKCGCLLKKEKAIAGKKKIIGVTKYTERMHFEYIDDEIVTPYYCKAHAPKRKK